MNSRMTGSSSTACFRTLVDSGQELLHQHLDQIVNIAPAEGNSPVRVLPEKTFQDSRPRGLTSSCSFNNSSMHADGRLARHTDGRGSAGIRPSGDYRTNVLGLNDVWVSKSFVQSKCYLFR